MNRATHVFLAAVLTIAGLLLHPPAGGAGMFDGQKGLYGQGRELVMLGRYGEALPLLNDYLASHPDGDKADWATFFQAKALVGLGDFAGARQAFERVIDRFPGTEAAHRSQYKLAMIALWQSNREEALRLLTPLVEHPNGALSAEAKAWHDWLKANVPLEAPLQQ